MTKDELFILQAFLKNVRNSEYVANEMMGGECDELIKLVEKEIVEGISDGYHTMSELYEHRHRLFLALTKIYDNYITPLDSHVRCWKSRLHDDGSSYEGWFILGMTVTRPRSTFNPEEPPTKYLISYHLPNKYWDLAKVNELEKAPYDGHTSKDVLERLLRL
jgi:hypothetical protein